MPFDPLPESLSDLWRSPHPEDMRAIELGCGDGRLLELLRRGGLWCAGLDRLPRSTGSAADVVGDACRPPLRAESLDLVVSGNLVRHLLPARPDLGFLRLWLGLLRAGGSVFILEDEPGSGPPAENFRDLQAFLARLLPESRGPLLTADGFLRALPADLRARVAGWGVMENAWPLDADAALDMLAGGRPVPGGEAARLMAAVAADGLACGRQWWCRLQNRNGIGS